MKPGEETPQNWQQPAQSLPQAPYQTPAEPPVAAAPIAVSPVSVAPVAPAPTPQPAPLQSPVPPVQETTPTIQAAPVAEPIVAQVGQIAVDQEVETSPDEFADDEDVAEEDPDLDTGDAALLRWQATEYIHHERTMLWYVILGVVVVGFIALALLVFNSITFAVLIPVMLVALVVYVRRPPSVLNYILSRKGLHVNDHLYAYDQFKAFGVVSHDDLHSVVLLPRKRFQVSQTVYFPEEVGESLVDMLAARLPMQEVKLDAIDRLLKKLRI